MGKTTPRQRKTRFTVYHFFLSFSSHPSPLLAIPVRRPLAAIYFNNQRSYSSTKGVSREAHVAVEWSSGLTARRSDPGCPLWLGRLYRDRASVDAQTGQKQGKVRR